MSNQTILKPSGNMRTININELGDTIRAECPDCGITGTFDRFDTCWECRECGALLNDEEIEAL